jgi:hypothetical protein
LVRLIRTATSKVSLIFPMFIDIQSSSSLWQIKCNYSWMFPLRLLLIEQLVCTLEKKVKRI